MAMSTRMVNSNMAISEIELKGESSSWDYLLTLDPNGGYIEDTTRVEQRQKITLTTKPYEINVRFNQSIGNLPEPIRPGYTFKGWFKTYSGFWPEKPNEYPYKEQIQLQSGDIWLWRRNATFEARWQPVNCTLTWDSNGGSTTTRVDRNVKYGSILGSLNSINIVPTRAGYTFLGWFTHPTHGVQVGKYTRVEMQKTGAQYKQTYYAHWKLDSSGT